VEVQNAQGTFAAIVKQLRPSPTPIIARTRRLLSDDSRISPVVLVFDFLVDLEMT
jgi:hypothetical protein